MVLNNQVIRCDPPQLKRGGIDRIGYLAIAIQKICLGFYHVGIIYENNNEKKFLHLAGHLDLNNDLPSDELYWVLPNIHPFRAQSIAGFCRRIWKSHSDGHIPYSFSSPINAFNLKDATFVGTPHKVGLTCATFVLTTFMSCGIHILDVHNWKSRPQDIEWQNFIITYFKNKGYDPAHLAEMQKEVGQFRFRPTEVAGASTIAPFPIKFEHAVRLGELVATGLETTQTP